MPDTNEDCEISLAAEASSPQEEVVIIRSRLQQAEEKCLVLRDELSHSHNECMHLQGIKARNHLPCTCIFVHKYTFYI